MATEAQISPHLASARELLDDITADAGADPHAKAAAAGAHATLVLAEQVAALRLVMAAKAVENGSVTAPEAVESDGVLHRARKALRH